MTGPLSPRGAGTERRDGIVTAEKHGSRCRIAVQHSEADIDFLWVTEGEAADVVSQLTPLLAESPDARRRRAAAICAPLTGLDDEDWRVVFAFRPDLKARLRTMLLGARDGAR